MTLKTRLAVMMILLLGAVMALQYLLLQREQRILAERISRFGRDIEESTRILSREGRWHHEGADSSHVAAILKRFRAVDSLALRDSTDVSVVVRVDPDSSRVERLEWSSAAGPDLGPGTSIRSFRTNVRERVVGESTTVELVFLGLDEDREEVLAEALPARGDGSDPANLVKVHLALPGGAAGVGRAIEVLYPVGDLTAELERARTRSGLWLAALLAVGAAGAVLVAVQFTRPIKTLEGSFGRVTAGDLEVRVAPERPDEIGRLTDSFNAMVGRLRETRAIEHRLGEAERLASVGRLAAGVAHEVRNPLNTMLLTLEQLRRKTAPPADHPERERFDRYVASVTGELERLERLVGMFLELSRDGDLALATIDAGDSLRAAAELFEPEARGRGVAIRVEIDGRLEVRADPARLPTVWNNLVANALRATASGGTVRLEASPREGEIEVAIRDDGIGIPAEQLGRIWEPFWSGAPDGTGLGLSLVRSLVERHGGRVEAESEPGTGTTVRVFLPVHGPGAGGETNA